MWNMATVLLLLQEKFSTVFSTLRDVAFAYAGHNVVLDIQATIPSTPEKPSNGPMWRVVVDAYTVLSLCATSLLLL